MTATLNFSSATYRTLIIFALIALISVGCQKTGSGGGFSNENLDGTGNDGLGSLVPGSGGIFGRDPSAVLGSDDVIPGGAATISVIPGGAGVPNRPNSLESFFGNFLGGANGGAQNPLQGLGGAIDPAKNPQIREFARAFCAAIEPNPTNVTRALVISYYINVLGRVPSEGEVNQMVSASQDPATLARTFVKSTEHLTNLVYANYRAFVGRIPNAGEVSTGVQIGRAGSPEDIIIHVLSSEQASKRVRQNNLIFSRQLFIKLWGRKGTTREVQAVFQRLNRKKVTKQALVREFLNASDYAEKLVKTMYMAYLFRQPNGTELPRDINIVKTNPMGSSQVQINLLASDEYKGLWTSHVRDMTRALCESGLLDR